jgi:hypothetical protein
MSSKILQCEMVKGCTADVTHLDAKGYVYCTAHGAQRSSYQRCRKLRPHEINRLKSGEALSRY